MLEFVRLLVLSAALILSVLIIVLPPNNMLWIFKIALSEYSNWWILLIALITALPGYSRGYWWVPQIAVAACAVAMMLIPLIQAQQISRKLPVALSKAFGSTGGGEPFSWLRLWKWETAAACETYSYSAKRSKPLTLDYYRSDTGLPAPCLVIVHGGGWSSGDNKLMTGLNGQLAAQGIHVAAITYGLAPQYRNPDQVEDVADALSYLQAHATSLNIDTARLALLGRSAGGQIALQAAYLEKLPGIKGVVAIYSPADMIWGYELARDNALLNSKTLITQYVGGRYEEVPEKYAFASALTHVTPDCPPTLMIHGGQDNMVAFGHNLRLMEKLKPAGVPHYLLELPWATHGCDYRLYGPSGQLSSYAILTFLKSCFEKQT